MIDYETFANIKHLHDKMGLGPSQISLKLGLDQRTVIRWLEEKRFRPRNSIIRSSKLDRFKDSVVQMLESYSAYTARQIFQRIQGDGYDGSYSVVKRFVRKIRPNRQKAYLTLAFAPGESAQVDWGSHGSIAVGNTQRRLSFFVMVLCYSRQMYVEFTVMQTMEHFLACHANAFRAFGGVPAKVMVDNLKSAVLRRTLGEAPVFNPKYLDFARHYGFDIAPCGVRKPNEKGRVENAVGYVKKNLLAGADLPSFAALAPAVKLWLDTVANVRVHGETKKKPAEMLITEQPHLNHLPENIYDIGTVSQVRASSQFRVTLDTNRYSVPARFAGLRLTMKTYPDRLCIYHENGLIARHVRSYERSLDFEDPDHPKELILQRRKAEDQKLFLRFQGLSPRAIDYFRELDKRHLNAKHHVRKIIALADIHGRDAVVSAMDDALALHAIGSDYIANIIDCRVRKLPEPGPLHLTRRSDLLDLKVQEPDLSVYENKSTRNRKDAP